VGGGGGGGGGGWGWGVEIYTKTQYMKAKCPFFLARTGRAQPLWALSALTLLAGLYIGFTTLMMSIVM
jgi:hypothetical protein